MSSSEMFRPWVDLAQDLADPVPDAAEEILDLLQEQLFMDEEWVWREGRRMGWWGAPLPMWITLSEPRMSLGDPTIRILMNVELLPSIGVTFEKACMLVSGINAVNTGSTLWVDPQNHSVNSSVTHYAHPNNEAILRNQVISLLAVLNYASAIGKAPHLEEMLESSPTRSPHPSSGQRTDFDELLTFPDEIQAKSETANMWERYGLESSLNYFRQIGLVTTGDDTHVTTEFPYTAAESAMIRFALGEVPHADSGSTALYTQDAAAEHPFIGVGLLSVLRLPHSLDIEEAAVLTNGLNWAEANEMTGIPAWGAWCPMNSGAETADLNHVFFSPGIAGKEGLAGTIGFYAGLRTRWALERLLSDDLISYQE